METEAPFPLRHLHPAHPIPTMNNHLPNVLFMNFTLKRILFVSPHPYPPTTSDTSSLETCVHLSTTASQICLSLSRVFVIYILAYLYTCLFYFHFLMYDTNDADINVTLMEAALQKSVMSKSLKVCMKSL